jgi:cell division protein FtsA
MFITLKKKAPIFFGIEIGTHSIKIVAGELLEDDVVELLGYQEVATDRVLKGEIVEAKRIEEQLMEAINSIENDVGAKMEHVQLAVTGQHVEHYNSKGISVIANHKEVTEDDIAQAQDTARKYNQAPDTVLINVCDRRYILDGKREVPLPLGMFCTRLETEVHLIYGDYNRIHTAVRIIQDILFNEIDNVSFSGLAAARAVVSNENAENGALVIDVGSGTTEYIVLHSPGVYHSGVITVGCDHIVNDLSIGLKISETRARELLDNLGEHGSACMTPDGRNRIVEIETANGIKRKIPVSTIERIVELRLDELFTIIREDLLNNDCYKRMNNGCFLCGGGALIPDVLKLAQKVLHIRTRQGIPHNINGPEQVTNSPRFATPVGLLRISHREFEASQSQNRSLKYEIKQDLGHLWEVIRRTFRW